MSGHLSEEALFKAEIDAIRRKGLCFFHRVLEQTK
jgi:hypothetical protein